MFHILFNVAGFLCFRLLAVFSLFDIVTIFNLIVLHIVLFINAFSRLFVSTLLPYFAMPAKNKTKIHSI